VALARTDTLGDSLAEAARVLGRAPDVLRILRAGGGGGADVLKIKIVGQPAAYAFRRRKPTDDGEPERWLSKDAVCAFLAQRFSDVPVDAQALADFLALPTGRDLPFPNGVDLLAYGFGAGERLPWSIAPWLEAPRLLDRPDAATYAALGRRLKAVHEVRFDAFWPELDRPGEAIGWDRWMSFMLGHFATPGFAATVGRDAADAILDLRPTPPSALVLVHGDAHPGNALVCDHDIRLIDWDEAGVGAPELDFAVLRYRTRQLDGGLVGPDERLFQAAIEGYLSAGGRLDARQLALHQLLFLMKQLALPRQPRHAAMTVDELAAEVPGLIRQLT
jgi:aminoglycoside phosphotransferase (APT) family kinase protein